MTIKFIIAYIFLFCYSNVKSELRRVCDYQSWAQYRVAPAKFFPEQIDFSLCSHVVFKYAILGKSEIMPSDWNHDGPDLSNLYKRLTNMKTLHPNLKCILSIGGYNAGIANLSYILQDKSRISLIAKQATAFLQTRNFDGLNLAFYHPSYTDVSVSEKNAFSNLLKAFHSNFKQISPSLLLTVTVPTSLEAINAFYDVTTIARVVDFISLDTFDFYGPWSHVVGHHSPLYSSKLALQQTSNADMSVRNWLEVGMPNDKINLGIALYGRGFLLTESTNHRPGASFVGASPGQPFTSTDGFAAYFEICPLFRESLVCSYWLEDQMVPYLLFNKSTWIGFDDRMSVVNKVSYAIRRSLGGVTLSSIDLDDFQNICGNGHYPLLKSINEKLFWNKTNNSPNIPFRINNKDCDLKKTFYSFSIPADTSLFYLIGGIVGGVFIVLLLVIIIIICLVRRHNSNKEGVEDNYSMKYQAADGRNVYSTNIIPNSESEGEYTELRSSQMDVAHYHNLQQEV